VRFLFRSNVHLFSISSFQPKKVMHMHREHISIPVITKFFPFAVQVPLTRSYDVPASIEFAEFSRVSGRITSQLLKSAIRRGSGYSYLNRGMFPIDSGI